jgi:histidinol-phosphate aminotransferase
MPFFRDNIEAMEAYIPGAPADEAGVVKLNQNENPYPPSPKAIEAMRQFDGASLRLYPDPLAGGFCRAAAAVLDVPAERILVGDGSDDLIIMIARAALGAGRKVVITDPTFPYYFTQGLVENARIVSVPAQEDFSLPIEEMAAAGGDVTFLAAPNSPTGATADLEKLGWLASQLKGLLVIDEAYADFAGASAQRDHPANALQGLFVGRSAAGFCRAGWAAQERAAQNQEHL